MDEPLEAKGSVGLWIHLGLLTIQLTISETRRQHVLPKKIFLGSRAPLPTFPLKDEVDQGF